MTTLEDTPDCRRARLSNLFAAIGTEENLLATHGSVRVAEVKKTLDHAGSVTQRSAVITGKDNSVMS